ncbi:MAG TPA: hypothetical protein VGV93_11740, partial [Acidimicrobiales bacterium]|nr:hypothetical protein [Acidimicrobiales bacterium]
MDASGLSRRRRHSARYRSGPSRVRAVGVVVAMAATLLATTATATPAGAAGFEIIRTVAGGGTPEDGVGDGGLATDAALGSPYKVALDEAGSVFIADGSRVRKVDSTGMITTVAGDGSGVRCDWHDPGCDPWAAVPAPGDGGPATQASVAAVGVALDAEGNIYLSGAERVRKIDAATGIITTVAGTGQFGTSGDGGPATEATISDPQGIDVDGAGNLYIAQGQGHVVRRVDTAGIITTIAGPGQWEWGTGPVVGDGGPATDAYLDFPQDVHVDEAGNVFIADSGGNVPGAIRKIDAATG